jgi:hypothetical protein
MINNHFALFQLPGNFSKTKKCAPYFRGNTQFPIYFQIREVFGVSFKTQKVMAKIERAKIVPKPFVLQKPATIQNNLDNNLFV